jgi:hypothetical protein
MDTLNISETSNEILGIEKIVFEKMEEILKKLVEQHQNESNKIVTPIATTTSLEISIKNDFNNVNNSPSSAVNPSSIDSIIDLVIQQTHISDIRRMSTDLVKNTTSLGVAECGLTKAESVPISNVVNLPPPVTHHHHHHNHHSNPTISTLLSASQMFISNENNNSSININSNNSQNANNNDLAKIKQSKKANQSKYSVWKPKTTTVNANLISDNMNPQQLESMSNNPVNVSNFITDKTNNLPVKVRKPHQSTLKNGEKKKEKKTIGLLNAASANLCNQIISNNNSSNILNLNNANSTSNRKSKPPTLISSLLEQQDLLKKQQLQSKLSADSFEQIWEDHCYTPKMPWLKINASPAVTTTPPPPPPPTPLAPQQPPPLPILIPTLSPTTSVPSTNTNTPNILATSNNLPTLSINQNQSIPIALLEPNTSSTSQSMFIAQSGNDSSTVASLSQQITVNKSTDSDKTVSSILSHISPPQQQSHQHPKEPKSTLSAAHSKKTSSSASVCRELAGLLPPPVNKLESEYLLSTNTPSTSNIVQNEKRRRKELSNLTNENNSNSINDSVTTTNNKSIKSLKKTVKTELTKPSEILTNEKGKKMSTIVFTKRTKEQERKILESFLVDGIDQEDINFLKRTYDELNAANVDSNNNNSDDNELATLVKKT